MSHQDSRFLNYQLNSDKVPKQFHQLIDLAQYWGTLGGVEYEFLIEQASNEVLSDLISRVQPYYGRILDEWLAPDSSFIYEMSNEYIAFTDLLASYDSAKVELQRRQNKM